MVPIGAAAAALAVVPIVAAAAALAAVPLGDLSTVVPVVPVVPPSSKVAAAANPFPVSAPPALQVKRNQDIPQGSVVILEKMSWGYSRDVSEGVPRIRGTPGFLGGFLEAPSL